MDTYTALALTHIRAAEMHADARRHALVKSLTGPRLDGTFDRRTAKTPPRRRLRDLPA